MDEKSARGNIFRNKTGGRQFSYNAGSSFCLNDRLPYILSGSIIQNRTPHRYWLVWAG